jgi:hypothetical protein
MSQRRWMRDEEAQNCCSAACRVGFTATVRRHHCRKCGQVFCDDCTSEKMLIHPSEVALPHCVAPILSRH